MDGRWTMACEECEQILLDSGSCSDRRRSGARAAALGTQLSTLSSQFSVSRSRLCAYIQFRASYAAGGGELLPPPFWLFFPLALAFMSASAFARTRQVINGLPDQCTGGINRTGTRPSLRAIRTV